MPPEFLASLRSDIAMRNFLRTCMRACFGIVVLFSATNVTVAQSPYSTFESELLFANCGKMGLLVESLRPDAEKIGLSQKEIRIAAEKRLRSARIFRQGGRPYIYINITVFENAFTTRFGYRKIVFDEFSKHYVTATVWTDGLLGIHDGDYEFIFSSAMRILDGFIAKYLRANKKACNKR